MIYLGRKGGLLNTPGVKNWKNGYLERGRISDRVGKCSIKMLSSPILSHFSICYFTSWPTNRRIQQAERKYLDHKWQNEILSKKITWNKINETSFWCAKNWVLLSQQILRHSLIPKWVGLQIENTHYTLVFPKLFTIFQVVVFEQQDRFRVEEEFCISDLFLKSCICKMPQS